MPGRYFIKTFGCQMNEYDSARMADALHAANGLTATDDPKLADVLLVNTCSVREKPEVKVYSRLGELRKLRQAGGALPPKPPAPLPLGEGSGTGFLQ